MNNQRLYLSKNFKISQLIFSPTATRLGLDNLPTKDIVANLNALTEFVLEPLYSIFGIHMTVSSGYRCIELNRALGSNDTSQHVKGQAVDLIFPHLLIADVITGIKNSKIAYDQLICEYSQWIHISFDRKKDKQRMEYFEVGHKLLSN